VDAVNGEILEQTPLTLYCKGHSLETNFQEHVHDNCEHQNLEVNLGGSAQYRALALPSESPIEGQFELVCDPHISAASPFGWHDKDGMVGPEFTYTRGNNVWAYEDTEGINRSLGNEPEGGTELTFDFAYDPMASVIENLPADVTNLFYVCNMMHDLTNLIGFDSQAGAYQENTYSTGGVGGDLVFAEAIDGSGNNNASFSLTPDGAAGRIQMYRWLLLKVFRIISPNSIASEILSNQASWSNTPNYNQLDFREEIAIALDGNMDLVLATEGCDNLVTDVDGKIALLRRGTCEFGQKAMNAQNAGAVAAIICNVPGVDGNGENVMDINEGVFGRPVTIPVISIGHSDCIKILTSLGNEKVTGEFKVVSNGPAAVSSGFDNTIITHEYAHGLSTRLIGGPSSFSCLTSDEQMGEGISDFFALATTVNQGDTGTDMRGMGNFVLGLEGVDRGYRRYPYSTDMNICPLTLDDMKGTSRPSDPSNGIHAVGEVWAAVLWDLYWAFTETYGWTEDWTDDTKGNIQAMKLIVDGMKMVPCNPSFEEMRDAIIAADDGSNTCLLWEVFARRGMGYLMSSNNTNDRDDNSSSFEPLPSCIKTLKIDQEITSLVQPGENIPIRIIITNHNDYEVDNVVISEILSAGLSLESNSLSLPHTVKGDTIRISLGNLLSQEERLIEYEYRTDPDLKSITKLYNSIDSLEDADEWTIDLTNSVGPNNWKKSELNSNSAPFSWQVNEIDELSDQMISYTDLEILGNRPTVRYWHKVNCTPVDNGGFVEYSLDGENWQKVSERFVLEGYNNPIAFDNLGIAGLEGYSGQTDEFVPAYLDFSDLKGQEIDLRFRFATYDYSPFNTELYTEENGWFIDDLELMDLKTYSINAFVSAANADTIYAEQKVIVIDSDKVVDDTGIDEPSQNAFHFSISPNPAQDFIQLALDCITAKDINIELLTVDGRRLFTERFQCIPGNNFKNIDISSYPRGIYLLRLKTNQGLYSHKVILN